MPKLPFWQASVVVFIRHKPVLIGIIKEIMGLSLKRIDCDPVCGFMVQSHSEDEVVSVAVDHVKKMHHMEMTREDMRARIIPV